MEFSKQIHPWVLKITFWCFLFTPKRDFYPTFWDWGEMKLWTHKKRPRPSPASGISWDLLLSAGKSQNFPLHEGVWEEILREKKGWVFLGWICFSCGSKIREFSPPKGKWKLGKSTKILRDFGEINLFSLGFVSHHQREESLAKSQESHGNNPTEITLQWLQEGQVGKNHGSFWNIPDLNSQK